MKKIIFILMSLVLFSTFVLADGIGGDVGRVTRAYITNAGADISAFAVRDNTNLVSTGTTNAVERARIFKTVSGTRYAIGEANISFRNATGNVSNASLESLTQLLDLDTKKVILSVQNVGRASGTLTMYILKNSNDNAVVICEGATARGNVGQGCASASEVTKETTIYPEGYTGSYTVTSYTDSNTGLSYWKVYGMTGTGMQSISLDLGGGAINKVASKEDYVSLDDSPFEKYVANLNVEYYVMFEGKKYLFVINEIDPNNNYASLTVPDINKNINVKPGESEEFDLNNDGENDVKFVITKLEYPFIFAELSTHTPEKTVEFITKEKEAVVQEGDKIKDYPGGIWSRFLKTVQTSKTTLYLLIIAIIAIASFFGSIGAKVMRKMWKAT